MDATAYGGAIDFVKTYRDTDFLKAKRWLVDNTVVRATASLRGANGPRVAPQARTSPLAADQVIETPPDYEVYEALLQSAPLQSSGLKYLLERGLSAETVSAFRIGQVSDSRAVLDVLVRAFGYQRINAAGLLTKTSTNRNRLLLFPEDSLVFPFLEDSQVAYMQARVISRLTGRGKWRNLNDRRPRVYNADTLLVKQHSPLAICEGVIDTLSAIELGYSAIGLLGVRAQLDEEQRDRLRGNQVVVLLDWDLPGETRAAELRKELRRFGIASTRKTRPSPESKDVNDYLRELRGRS